MEHLVFDGDIAGIDGSLNVGELRAHLLGQGRIIGDVELAGAGIDRVLGALAAAEVAAHRVVDPGDGHVLKVAQRTAQLQLLAGEDLGIVAVPGDIVAVVLRRSLRRADAGAAGRRTDDVAALIDERQTQLLRSGGVRIAVDVGNRCPARPCRPCR